MPVVSKALEDIELVAKENSLEVLVELPDIQRTFKLAMAFKRLRELFTQEVCEQIMELMNSPLGFLTDRDPSRQTRKSKEGGGEVKVYEWWQIKDVLIETVLRGARFTGNEMNIIASRCYLTKEYYLRKIGEVPGVTNIIHCPGRVEVLSNGMGVGRYGLSWNMHGVLRQIQDPEGKPAPVFQVPSHGMGADACAGKIVRRACKLAYQIMTGSTLLAGDDGSIDDANVIDVSSKQADKPNALGNLTQSLKDQRQAGDADMPDDRRRVANGNGNTAQQGSLLGDDESPGEIISEEDAAELAKGAACIGLEGDALVTLLQQKYGKEATDVLSPTQAADFQTYINAQMDS